MAMHKTESGYAELVESWRDGRQPSRNYASMPAVIISDNGDGENSAWKITGAMFDAARVIGALEIATADKIARFIDGNRITCESVPKDFWIEDEDGNFYATPDKNVIAW